jgi:hypothetical protein
MTRRRLFVLGSMLAWMIVLVLVVKASVGRLSVPPWGNPVGDNLSAEVAGETQVGQQFTAPFPGLSRIDVALDRATISGDQQIAFHLKTDPSATEDLWTARLSAGDLEDGLPYSFEFPPIRDSEGQTYYFYLESPASAPGDAVAVRYSLHAGLDGATAYLNSQPVNGDLQFHTFYTLGAWDQFDLLLARMTESRPYLFGTKGFYAGLVVAYVCLLGAFLWQTAQSFLKDDRS